MRESHLPGAGSIRLPSFEIPCKGCGTMFKVREYALAIRRYSREQIDLDYGVTALPWIE